MRNRGYGYNNDNGGSHKGRVSQATKEKLRIAYYNMSEEQKIKMKQHRKGMLGKHHSKETKQMMREKAIGRIITDEAKEKNRLAHLGKKQSLEAIEKQRKAMIGRKMSDETKKKLSLAKKGKPNNRLGVKLSEETKMKIAKANYKKVYCYETNKIYQSIQQTEKELNVTNVSLVCNGKLKSIKGYHFKFV